MDRMGQVTKIIEEAKRKGRPVIESLLPVVYDELKSMAQNYLRSDRAGRSLTATVLVHEAYLRLSMPKDRKDWENRRHFFGAAAEAMRRILVDLARKKNRLRHGKEYRRVLISVDDISDDQSERLSKDIVFVDRALAQFEVGHPKEAHLIELRFFVGLSMEEASKVIGVSRRTAQRHWEFAKARLFQLIEYEKQTHTS